MKPFILRRTKDKVLSDLPPKILQDVYIDPSPLQRLLYQDFARSDASQQVQGALKTEGPADAAADKAPHVFQVACCLIEDAAKLERALNTAPTSLAFLYT